MQISKKISAVILSFVLVIASFGTANAAKRLTAAVADWTGGEITCQVAVSILEDELGYKVKRVVFPSGTGLWEAIAAGEIDFACESWPSYAEADTVMLKGPLVYDGDTKFMYEGDGSVKLLGTSGIIGLSDYMNAAVGMDASRLVPAALTIVGPRCLIALLTRIHIDVDVVVRIVSDRCRQ